MFSENTSSPFSSGVETEVDVDEPLAWGSASVHHIQTNATRSYPQWPKEIDVVIKDDGRKVKLVHQSRLLQDIFKDAFGNIRNDLLFKDAFPDAVATPKMVRGGLVTAAQDYTIHNGIYNASAACVHQCLLSDVDYEIVMARLVSDLDLFSDPQTSRSPTYSSTFFDRVFTLVL